MAQILNEMMEVVHDQSLPTIELLQESFPNNESFMISISTLLDPRYVFLIYAPLLFAFNKRVGHRMILALTLAEWANQCLKWLLAGERPYWYVHERAEVLSNRTLFEASAGPNGLPLIAVSPPPQLKQFPVTCELGAGSPSGHAMVTATVWYILIDAYLRGELPILERVNYFGINRRREELAAAAEAEAASSVQSEQQHQQQPQKPPRALAKLSWSLYTLMLVAVSLSRVYLACHFPHQCVCGALLGALTARLVVEHVPMERLSSRNFAQLTGFMFASALATYAVLRMSGFDPLWSVDKGMRWCAKKEYIHLDTTPFFSMMRYLGFCFGCGLAYDGAKISAGELKRLPALASADSLGLLVRRLACAALAVIFGQALLALPAPRFNAYLFYFSQFAIYALFSCAIAGPIPRFVKRLAAFSGGQQAQKVD